MSANSFQLDLAAYGPHRAVQTCVGHVAAQQYCRELATRHYENFTVASWLMPRHLRQHFCNVYAYCRWADDLADEVHGGEESLKLLAWWEEQLHACYAGQTTHPVFVALRETIDEFAIPINPFRDLLIAFRQDQTQTRYETFDDLLEYCRYSANPVGHLVLYLGRSKNELTTPLSDSICTGLQLANHWQDVARDFANQRVYLPSEDLRRFDVPLTQLAEATGGLEFCQLLKFEVARAQEYLSAGWPLVTLVSPELKLPIELFLRGGLATLDAIGEQDYDVLAKRPKVGKLKKGILLLQSLSSRWLGRARGSES